MTATQENNPTDPAELLAEFISSGRSEAAFVRLVEHLGGLVFSSALRRAGNRQIAEEVTQNVFAIIARKADSLRRHPSLTAWVFQTTRYEASKAMRSEQRRQRKHEALAREIATTGDGDSPQDDATWREAAPMLDASLDQLSDRDRELVLLRFFENKKFREIAEATGRSEAACKVQLKRALAKLSGFLSIRGATLSVGAIASGLAAELARSAPSQAAASLAPQALAASGTLSTTALVANTVQTMSTLKTVAVTGAAVLALASIPLLWQASETSKLNHRLAELESLQSELETRMGTSQETVTLASPSPAEGVQTIRDILDGMGGPVDAQQLLDTLMEAMTTMDIAGIIKAVIPLIDLDPDEYHRLVDEIQASPSHREMKQVALQMIGSFAPSDNPRESIERMMAYDVEARTYGRMLSNWATTDPAAAEAWYLEKLEGGDFEGKGVSSTASFLFSQLAGGIAKTDPARAIAMLEETQAGDESRSAMVHSIAGSIGELVAKNGDESHLERFIEAVPSDHRSAAVGRIAGLLGDLEKSKDLLEKYIDDEKLRSRMAVDTVFSRTDRPAAERADWIVENLPAAQTATAVGQFIERIGYSSSPSEIADIDSWLARQAPAEVRDQGNQAFTRIELNLERYQEAFERTQRIGDPEIKRNAQLQVADLWMQSQPEAAGRILPPEIIEDARHLRSTRQRTTTENQTFDLQP